MRFVIGEIYPALAQSNYPRENRRRVHVTWSCGLTQPPPWRAWR